MAYVCYLAAGDRPGFITQTGEGAVEASFPDRVAALGLTYAEVPLPSLLGVDPSSIYFAAGAIAARPALPAKLSKPAISANGTDKAVISGLPNPTVLTLTSSTGTQAVTVTDGALELTSDVADTFFIRASHWPHLDWSATVTAT